VEEVAGDMPVSYSIFAAGSRFTAFGFWLSASTVGFGLQYF